MPLQQSETLLPHEIPTKPWDTIGTIGTALSHHHREEHNPMVLLKE